MCTVFQTLNSRGRAFQNRQCRLSKSVIVRWWSSRVRLEIARMSFFQFYKIAVNSTGNLFECISNWNDWTGFLTRSRLREEVSFCTSETATDNVIARRQTVHCATVFFWCKLPLAILSDVESEFINNVSLKLLNSSLCMKLICYWVCSSQKIPEWYSGFDYNSFIRYSLCTLCTVDVDAKTPHKSWMGL